MSVSRHNTFSFYMHASMRVHTRFMMSNLHIVQSSRVCTSCVHEFVDACVHVKKTRQMCIQIASQRQQSKLYEHVHVLRYDSSYDTRCKFC